MRVLFGTVGSLALLTLIWNLALYVQRVRVIRTLTGCTVPEPLGMMPAARAFVLECVAAFSVLLLTVAGWCMRRCRTRADPRGPVVLVHGWRLNRGCFWLLRRRLLHAGWGPVCCFDYGSFGTDIERATQPLHAMITSLPSPGQPIMLIGHGLGGLVLRFYLRRHPAPNVRRVITLGTPHFGTDARWIAWLTRKRLTPGSPLMNLLNAADRVPRQFDVIAIHSAFDATVLPPANASYPGALNIEVDGIGHNALLFSSKVYRLIAENLAAPLT